MNLRTSILLKKSLLLYFPFSARKQPIKSCLQRGMIRTSKYIPPLKFLTNFVQTSRKRNLLSKVYTKNYNTQAKFLSNYSETLQIRTPLIRTGFD